MARRSRGSSGGYKQACDKNWKAYKVSIAAPVSASFRHGTACGLAVFSKGMGRAMVMYPSVSVSAPDLYACGRGVDVTGGPRSRHGRSGIKRMTGISTLVPYCVNMAQITINRKPFVTNVVLGCRYIFFLSF